MAPVNSSITLKLPLIISYHTWEGEENHGGQAGPGLHWGYVYTFQRAFDPTNFSSAQMAVTPCS
jgi:hypothetical protein